MSIRGSWTNTVWLSKYWVPGSFVNYVWTQLLPRTSYGQNRDSWSSTNVRMFKKVFQSHYNILLRVTYVSFFFFFMILILFILSLRLLSFLVAYYSSRLSCISKVCLWHGLYVCLFFLFLYMCSLLVLCSSFVVLLSCCFSLCSVAFECNEQQATNNETQTLRRTKKHVLKSLTLAELQESIIVF